MTHLIVGNTFTRGESLNVCQCFRRESIQSLQVQLARGRRGFIHFRAIHELGRIEALALHRTR